MFRVVANCSGVTKGFHTCFGLIKGQGHGAKGQNDYQFSLAFRLPVNPEVRTSPVYLDGISNAVEMYSDDNLMSCMIVGELQVHTEAGEYYSKESSARLVG